MVMLPQYTEEGVCVQQHCESSGRKEVTRYLICHELLSLRLAGYISDANTEQWPPPGKVVACNYAVTQSYLLPPHACMVAVYKTDTERMILAK